MSKSGPPHSTPVVLVVDDHADTREMYTTFLATMGLVTLEATTCAEALARVATAAVDVLVLDRRLPDGDGAEVVRALRADARTRAVPIIILSGHPHEGTTGVDVYLVKPVAPDILYAEITRLLEASG
jgi:CheY-like chemotaxis protein